MLQLGSTGRQFFLGHAQILGQSLRIGFGGLHALGQIANLLLAGGLILRELIELAVLVVDEKRRGADIGNGHNDKNPFADIALRLGVVYVRLFTFRHKWVSSWKWAVDLLFVRYRLLSIAFQVLVRRGHGKPGGSGRRLFRSGIY